jgi:nucleotide-binding universal stress UspA family protein
MNIHTILFPTDLSESAQGAFPLACSLARDCGARVIALHVMLPPMGHDEINVRRHPEEYYRGTLEALQQVHAAEGNVRVEHRLETGDPAEAIVQIAGEVDAGLIVMGTHGRSGLGRLLLGSVAERVLREAPCPVLTVRSSLPVAKTPLLEKRATTVQRT